MACEYHFEMFSMVKQNKVKESKTSVKGIGVHLWVCPQHSDTSKVFEDWSSQYLP